MAARAGVEVAASDSVVRMWMQPVKKATLKRATARNKQVLEWLTVHLTRVAAGYGVTNPQLFASPSQMMMRPSAVRM